MSFKVCFECGVYTEGATVNEDGMVMSSPLECDHKKYTYSKGKFNRQALDKDLEHVPSEPLYPTSDKRETWRLEKELRDHPAIKIEDKIPHESGKSVDVWLRTFNDTKTKLWAQLLGMVEELGFRVFAAAIAEDYDDVMRVTFVTEDRFENAFVEEEYEKFKEEMRDA